MISRVLLFSLLICSCSAYKVLLFSSKFGFSHMNYLGSIADTLQAAGNNVTVLQPILNAEVRGTGCELAKVISVQQDEVLLELVEEMKNPEMWKKIWTVNTKNPIGVVIHGPKLSRVFDAGMNNVLRNKDLMVQLRNEKFDIGIVEMFDYAAFPIMHELGIKTLIGTHSTVITDKTSVATGNPIHPSYVPPMQSAAGDDGSFSSRLSNIVFSAFSYGFEKFLEGRPQEYMNKHHPNAPSISETIGNMPFIFTNSEPLLDFPRPSLRKIVDLGGIGLKTAKKLDENWLKILSQRKRNVLISFGSIAPSSQMPKEFKESILASIKKFPDVTFIWKYETPEDGFGSEVANLHLSKWTPQTDLLASGHITLFITHGGAGSVLEAASSGVPLVAVPLFGDQHRNALMAERFGYATQFDKHSLAIPSAVEGAIRKGLEDKEMKAAAVMARDLLKARPFSPQDLLIRHVDLAVKFGNLPTLAPSARHFSFIQYHNLDVVAFFALIFTGVVFLLISLLRRCFFRKNVIKAKQQ